MDGEGDRKLFTDPTGKPAVIDSIYFGESSPGANWTLTVGETRMMMVGVQQTVIKLGGLDAAVHPGGILSYTVTWVYNEGRDSFTESHVHSGDWHIVFESEDAD